MFLWKIESRNVLRREVCKRRRIHTEAAWIHILLEQQENFSQIKRNEPGTIPNSLPNDLIKFMSKLWGSLQFPYSALKVFYRCFQQMTSAMRESTERSGSTILRPLTSARNYATIADRKSANSEGNILYQKNNGYFKSEKEIPSQNSLPLTTKFDWVSCGGTESRKNAHCIISDK